MTVETLVAKQNQAGTGVDQTFNFTFKALDESHIYTAVDDAAIAQGDVTVVLNADQDNSPGGTVTFDLFAPALDAVVTIFRSVPLNQLVNYTAYDAFPAEVNEQALDKHTMTDQQLTEVVDRTLRFPISESGTANLANKTTRANKYLAFDNAGDFAYPAGTDADPNAVQKPASAITVGNFMAFDSQKDAVDSGKKPADIDAKLAKTGGTLTGNVIFKTATFVEVLSPVNVNWTLSNKIRVTDAGTIVFQINPVGPTNLILVLPGGNNLPGAIKWPNAGSIPVLTGFSIITFYYDGTDYYGIAVTDFQ